MASEYPRRHVWRGDDGQPLTYLITFANTPFSKYLVKAHVIVAAAAQAIDAFGVSDDMDFVDLRIRPLNVLELKKVNLVIGEVVELDPDSYTHLTTHTEMENGNQENQTP